MYLEKGDKIGVCATADYIDKNKYFEIKNKIENKYQIELIEGENLFKKHGCFAGKDEERLNDLNNFISNEEIKAIFFARGGYGSAPLLPYINYNKIKNNPKIFMGYSDVTSILLAIYTMTNLPICYYGPMITTHFHKPLKKITRQSFELLLFKTKEKEIIFREEETAKFNVIKYYKNEIRGKIVAGCLTLFSTLLGTKYIKLPENTILFLEDKGEETYRIDRYLSHIINSDILKNCSGLILDICCYKPSERNKETIPLKKRILEIFDKYKFPIMFWNCFGHREKKIILPIGKKIKIDLNKKICIIEK
ncbi:MAG TPA: LD-carboxypeptidase [bacterium]|nr:LD-carboxypeptidase [bacterium]HOL47570.1 LD-carboxypeptidase [bacterium]HPQ18832.1 LD-carboxypeptidase [bacterium]